MLSLKYRNGYAAVKFMALNYMFVGTYCLVTAVIFSCKWSMTFAKYAENGGVETIFFFLQMVLILVC
jgi:hypothetical protein